MGLLRKHIRDDAGRRVPIYRTGWWPWRLPHENELTPEHDGALRSAPVDALRRWFGWGVFAAAWGAWTATVIAVAVAWGGAWRMVPALGLVAPGFLVASWVESLLTVTRARALWVRGALLGYGRCPSCGYELVGQATCPECGAVWSASGATCAERDLP